MTHEKPSNQAKRFRDFSIKTKLVVFTMVATLASLILTLGAVTTLDRKLTKKNMVDEINAISQLIVARSEVAINFGDLRNSQSNVDALKSIPQYVLTCLYGLRADALVLFAQYPTDKNTYKCPEPPDDLTDFETVTSQYIHQWTPVLRNGQATIGYLYLRRSLQSLNLRLMQFAWASAFITLMVLLATYSIIARVQKIISQPILNLSELATNIAKENDYRKRADVKSRDEVGSLSKAFNSMLDTIEQTEQELKFMAFYDALTGLPNRRYFMETLQRDMTSVQRGQRSIALFLIDLDGFKSVNDTIGHDAGDEVLTQVSRRAEKILSKTDMISRLGGDEFTVILSNIATPETLRRIALNIIKVIEEPIAFKEQRADVSASIGIAMAPGDADTMDSLLKLSDAAMYRAKAGGKGTFYFYNEAIDEQMKAFQTLEEQVHHKLNTRQLAVQYHPILTTNKSGTIGFFAELTSTDKKPNDGTPFIMPHVRHISNPKIAALMTEYIFDHVIQELSQLSRPTPLSHKLKIIISVGHAQLISPQFQSFVEHLSGQLALSGFELLLAVDKASIESTTSNLRSQLVLSDDGHGVENLGSLAADIHWCLATLPNIPTTQWYDTAWKNLVQAARETRTQLIGHRLNTQEQFAFCKSHGIQLATGQQLCHGLMAQDISSWLFDHTDSLKLIS